MKKLILLAALSGVCSLHADIREAGASIFKKAKVYPKDTNVSLEIKNKGDDFFLAIKNGGYFMLKDGKRVFRVPKGTTVQFSPDIQKPTELYVWEKAPQDVMRDYAIVSFPTGMTLYLTRHTSQLTGESEFNPQTGPGEGVFKKTDTALSLKNNVTQKHIKQKKAPKTPEPEVIKGDKEVFEALGLGSVTSAKANKVLAVDESADLDTIKTAYKKLSIKWHPDKNPMQKELATKVFQVISAANTAMQELVAKYPAKKAAAQAPRPAAEPFVDAGAIVTAPAA